MANAMKNLIIATAAAVALAACGSSSSATAPSGYTIYHGQGFSVAVPEGFVAQPDTSIVGLPAGASALRLTRGGVPEAQANAEILTLVNPSLTMTVDQVATNLREADSTNKQLSQVSTAVNPTSVRGASAARIVTESYVSRISPASTTATRFQRTWLMVTPKPGKLIDIVVISEPDRGGHLDPSTIIKSFRLQ